MDTKYSNILYKLCKKAFKKNEMPVSAILVRNNKIIAKAYNKKNIKKNPILHAEIICLFKAYKKLKRWNLNDCELYVSLEPCSMCKEIIAESRINKVIYMIKQGEINNKYKKTKYVQMYDKNSKNILKYINTFFDNRRNVEK